MVHVRPFAGKSRRVITEGLDDVGVCSVRAREVLTSMREP